MTSRQYNRELVSRYFDCVLQSKHIDQLSDYITNDFIYHTAYASEPIIGADQFRAVLEAMYQAFSPYTIALDDCVAATDRVAARWSMVGVHNASFQGIPASHRTIQVCGISIYHIREGKLAENWALDTGMWDIVTC